MLTGTTNGTIFEDYQYCGIGLFERLLHERHKMPAKQSFFFFFTAFIDIEYKTEVITYYTSDLVFIFHRHNVSVLSRPYDYDPMTLQWLEMKHIAESQPEQCFSIGDIIIWGHEITIIH